MESTIGYIFLPDKPNERFESVRLNQSQDDIQIEIPGFEKQIENIEIICGFFNGIGKLSFVNCNKIKGEIGVAGSVATFSIEYLFNDVHFNKIEELFFDKARIGMPSLFSWIGVKIIENPIFHQDSINIKTLPEIKFEITPDLNISFSFSYSCDFSFRETLFKENASLVIESMNKKLSLWDFIDLINRFKKFLLFVTNSNPESEWITFFVRHEKYDLPEGELMQIPLETYKDEIKSKYYNHTPMLQYSNVKESLNEVLKNWFTNDKLFASVDLVLEKSLNTGLSRENHFLNSCFSIEIFHRRFYTNSPIFNKAEFKDLKKRLLINITDPEELKFLNDKFAHVNEPTFKDRLNSFRDDFSSILPDDQDVDAFIKKIVDTRNSLVHRSSDKAIFFEIDMFYASIYIESVVKLNVFKQLGFNQSDIDSTKSNTKNILKRLHFLNAKRQPNHSTQSNTQ